MRRKFKKLTKGEMELILSQNPQPGDVIKLQRNHPHISDTTPFLHLDVLYIRYHESGKLEIIGKDHVPVD